MLRDFLTNKRILGGIAFVIVFAVACAPTYQHDIADERKTLAESEEVARQSEITEKVSDTDSKTEQAADVTSVENTTQPAEIPITKTTDKDVTSVESIKQPAEIPITKTTDKVEKDTIFNKIFANLTKQARETDKKARVSPHGFGPYPNLPPGFPEDYWDTRIGDKESELLARVRIKLLEQGKNVVGASMQNGLVYPTIPGTIYVEWDVVGSERYITRIMSDPFTVLSIPGYGPERKLTEKDIPAGIKVITLPDGGIDPYQFLGLKE